MDWSPPEKYLASIRDYTESHFQKLEGKRVAILGASGFIGTWLSTALTDALREGLEFELNLVSRSGVFPSSLMEGVSSKNLRIWRQDLSLFVPKEITECDFQVIASTSSSPLHGNSDHSSILNTTQRLVSHYSSLKQTQIGRTRRLVHLSSGAVYKCHKKTQSRYPENDDVVASTEDSYRRSKIDLEAVTKSLASSGSNWQVSNPRIFAVYGPGLPLDAHFAIGNFVSSVLRKEPIVIQGNPLTVRSYLHISDLCVAILKLMVEPVGVPLNLGSTNMVTMRDLARLISAEFPHSEVRLRPNEELASFYVPEATNATKFLGEIDTVDFISGIREWILWLRSKTTAKL